MIWTPSRELVVPRRRQRGLFTVGPAFWGGGLPIGPLYVPSTLLLHFDGANGSTTFTDSSSYNTTMTRTVGTGALSTALSKFGPSCLYSTPGQNLYIQGTLGAAATGSTSWFIDMWLFRTASQDYCGLAQWNNSNAGIILKTPMDGGGYTVCLTRNGSYFVNGSTTIPLNTWTHVLVSTEYINTSTQNTRIFVNGVLDGYNYSNTGTYVGSPTTSTIFYIGRHDQAGFGGLLGYVDEYHVVTGSAITANFTPPSIPYYQ